MFCSITTVVTTAAPVAAPSTAETEHAYVPVCDCSKVSLLVCHAVVPVRRHPLLLSLLLQPLLSLLLLWRCLHGSLIDNHDAHLIVCDFSKVSFEVRYAVVPVYRHGQCISDEDACMNSMITT